MTSMSRQVEKPVDEGRTIDITLVGRGADEDSGYAAAGGATKISLLVMAGKNEIIVLVNAD